MYTSMYQVLYGVFFYRNRHDQLPSVCPRLYTGDHHLPRVLQVSLYVCIHVHHSIILHILYFCVKYLDGAMT